MSDIYNLVMLYAATLPNRTVDIDCDAFSKGLFNVLTSDKRDCRIYSGKDTHQFTNDPQPLSFVVAVSNQRKIEIYDLTVLEPLVAIVESYEEVVKEMENVYGGTWKRASEPIHPI